MCTGSTFIQLLPDAQPEKSSGNIGSRCDGNGIPVLAASPAFKIHLAKCTRALRSYLLLFKHRLCKRHSSDRVGRTGAFIFANVTVGN